MKEILSDGLNYVDDDGDVKSIDHPVWEQQQFVLDSDHLVYGEDSSEALADTSESTPGAAIKLSDRAVAIDGIMRYFNQTNKSIGLAKSRGYNSFDPHYGREAPEVASNMNAKAERLYKAFNHYVDILMQADTQRKVGFDDETIAGQEKGLTRDLYAQYGPGRDVYAPDRAKLVRRVKATARKTGRAASPN